MSRNFAQAGAAEAPHEALGASKALLLPWGPWGEVRPDAPFITATLAVAFVAGALATVGLYARVTTPCAALADTLLVAHWFSYGDHHHAEALMLIALDVLALSPCAEVWSLDAVRRRRAGRETPPDANVFARWPLRLIEWVMALTCLSAAGSKLAYGGVQWFNGHTVMHKFFFLSVYASMGISFFQTIVLYCVFVESMRRYWPRALRLRLARSRARSRPLLRWSSPEWRSSEHRSTPVRR